MGTTSEAIAPVIAVDKAASVSLHKQIYDGFRTAILRGELHPGQRVPSSRAFGLDVKVSRIPVLNAYAQLLAEGYFESRKGAGTFVSHTLPDNFTVCDNKAQKAVRRGQLPRPVARRALLAPKFHRTPWQRGIGAFSVHQPAFDHFPFALWSSLTLRHSRNPPAEVIHNVDPLGSENFRDVICSYLRTARAVHCQPQQIMVVSGSQQALEISARVLLGEGSPVWIEDPGYRLARNVFAGAGCRLVPVPVDEEGLVVSIGIKRSPKARAAYVTPSHQYPLGATMSASRRMQLLNWAQSSGAWVIEDDYDSEYRFESMPISSLQGLDREARVIYIGTFSKVLFPSLRVGYIVIPEDLLDQFVAVRSAMDIFPPYLNQEVITDFMREGHFARHVRKMRLLYGERRSALVRSIHQEFGDAFQIHGSAAGMHLVVTLPKGLVDQEIAEQGARKGLWLWPLSPSYLGQSVRQGFILGFSNVAVETIPRVTSELRRLIPKQGC